MYWDVAAANRFIRFCRLVLRLNGGQFEGLPFDLHPSQKFIYGSIFGWKRPDGTRRFRRAFIEQAKGSGKSPGLAAAGLYCLVSDGEPRAEIYAAASKKDQAMVLFRDAVAMFQQSPKLFERLTPSGKNPTWNLADLNSASFFRPISADDGQSGPRPHCALCDEIHEMRDGYMLEMLERGFKWRRQPLLVMATNSGSDRHSVCWQEHKHAVDVAAGDIEDDTSFSFVCGLDEGDDPLEDPACWEKANPLIDVTVTRDYLAGVVAQAKAIPGKLNNILRLHFCQWTEAENAWMPRATIERCVADFDPLEHEGKDIWVGADLARVQDFLALGYACRTGEVEVERLNMDGTHSVVTAPTYDVWADAWTPGDTLVERAIRDSAPYELWARDGWINAPPGRRIRFDYPAARLAEMDRLYNIRRLAYDDHAWDRFEEELAVLGLDLPIISHPQGGTRRASLPQDEVREARRAREDVPRGLWMPGSVVATEALILEGRIRLLNNPALFSGFLGATFEEDPYGHRWLSKRRATTRIDILVAIVMAIGAAEMQAETIPIDITALVA